MDMELNQKQHTYKIKGRAYLSSNMAPIISALAQIKTIPVHSIKYKSFDDIIQFKFKGSENQLREVISNLGNNFYFKTQRIKKVLF